MKKRRHIPALLLACSMMCTLFPSAAIAEENGTQRNTVSEEQEISVRSAVQSSTDGDYAAANAADGSEETISATQDEANAWWRADLGQSVPVGTICLNETGGNEDYQVKVLDENLNVVWEQRQLSSAEGELTVETAGFPGRYVEIRLNGTGSLRLSEVAVYEAENLALHKEADQSSIYEGHDASYAVDGNTDGNFAAGTTTHTNEDQNAWWQVDLGSEQPISYIQVFNRTDGAVPMQRLSDYTVSVLDEDQNTVWSMVQADYPDPSVIHIAGGAVGRYVKIQLNGKNYLSLSEVQVYKNPYVRYEGSQTLEATNTDSGSDKNALTDGDVRTWWQTGVMENASAEITLDLGTVTGLQELRITPQQYQGQDIEHNDRPERFDLWVSSDGENYVKALEDESVPYADYNDNSTKSIALHGVQARYLKLDILNPTGSHTENGQTYERISIAELDVVPMGTSLPTGTVNRGTIGALKTSIQSGSSLPADLDYFHLRSGLTNSYLKLANGEPTKIAYVGGSITYAQGWKDYVTDYVRESFPENENITFIESGIPSYDSTPHAFRLQKDVFSQGQVDLMIYEAAVNDETNGRSEEEIQLACEGIIRQAYENNPNMDIVFLYFTDDWKIEEYKATGESHIINCEDAVAEHYDITTIDLSQHVIESMNRGEYDWTTFGGLHPAQFGHKIYANRLCELLTAYWETTDPAGEPVNKSEALPELMYENSYTKGMLYDVYTAQTNGMLSGVSGFDVVSSWNPRDGLETRQDFVNVPMLCATEPGSKLSFTFSGTTVGLFVAAGPRSGMIQYSIDGGEAKTVDLFTEWSTGLHIPWANILENNLTDGKHTMTIELLDSRNPASQGTECNIRYFIVNQTVLDANTDLAWDMEEGSGSTITDNTGSYAGTLSGGVTWTEGNRGTGLDFDGTGYVDLGIAGTSQNWTISAWVNSRESKDDNAVLISGPEGDLKINQWNNTGKVGFTEYGVEDYLFDYSVPLGEWVQLTFVSDSRGTSLYVNGKYRETNTARINMPAARIAANARGGAGSWGFFNGRMDELKIYSRPLSDEEIKALYVESTGNLALNRSYTAYNYLDDRFVPEHAFDGDISTAWATTGTDQVTSGDSLGDTDIPSYVEVDFGEDTTFNQVIVREYLFNNTRRLNEVSVQVMDSDGNWIDKAAFTAADSGTNVIVLPEPVTTRKARIYIKSIAATDAPAIAEVEIYNKSYAELLQTLDHFEYTILQRDEQDAAVLTVDGYAAPGAAKMQVRAVLSQEAERGESTGWIDASAGENNEFDFSIPLSAGGWYSIEVRTFDSAGDVLAEKTIIKKIGVGDVFIVSGQSNSACFGSAVTAASEDRVAVYSARDGLWRHCEDPLPSNSDDIGYGGSPWPAAGDALVEELKIPVGFVVTGRGGAAIAEFDPVSGPYYTYIKEAVTRLKDTGFKAILWHQGETDAINGTSTETYLSTLRAIISQSRQDAGFHVPWIVANVSYHTSSSVTSEGREAVRLAQQQSWEDENVFMGPDTDQLLDGYRAPDGIHFSETGLKRHGEMWAESILQMEAELQEEDTEVSKTTLEYFLNSAKEHVANVDTDGCIQEVKDLFAEAISEGEAVMADENATRDEVMDASFKLMKAIHALNFKGSDKTDLEMAVELAEMIDLGKYVEAGQQEFADALAGAKDVLADGGAGQEEVDAAWDALVTAMENLRLKAEKSALEELLNEAAGIDLNDYTEESVEVFRAAFASAQAVFADETLSEADQQTVDAAVTALKQAKDGLTAQNRGAGADTNTDTDGSVDPGNAGNSGTEGGNGTEGGSNAGAKAAKTGDTAAAWAWFLVMAAAAGCGVIVFCSKKKQKRSR